MHILWHVYERDLVNIVRKTTTRFVQKILCTVFSTLRTISVIDYFYERVVITIDYQNTVAASRVMRIGVCGIGLYASDVTPEQLMRIMYENIYENELNKTDNVIGERRLV